jgi:hypothetical protein
MKYGDYQYEIVNMTGEFTIAGTFRQEDRRYLVFPL